MCYRTKIETGTYQSYIKIYPVKLDGTLHFFKYQKRATETTAIDKY